MDHNRGGQMRPDELPETLAPEVVVFTRAYASAANPRFAVKARCRLILLPRQFRKQPWKFHQIAIDAVIRYDLLQFAQTLNSWFSNTYVIE
jgi:hypothetical protein